MEQLFAQLFRNARPIVRDDQQDFLARLDRRQTYPTTHLAVRLQFDGLTGITHQIDQHPMELFRIDFQIKALGDL